jgi:hypothetical protein
MRKGAVIVAFLCGGTSTIVAARPATDPPFNPFHINQLPPEIRRAVFAKCPTRTAAAHYFATYYRDEIRLHFEYLYCAGVSYCKSPDCLREIYRPRSGHYQVVKKYYGAAYH